MLTLLLIAAASYLLGSIPFGYLLVRIVHGEDVRRSGSGNIGATNVARRSPLLGVITLLLDALKGAGPVWLASRLVGKPANGLADSRFYALLSLAAVCAVLGHMFPVWLRFRGGKGVATSLGAFAPVAPYGILGALTVFLLVTLVSRFVSLGSIVAAASFPFVTWLLFRGQYEDPVPRALPMAVVSCLVIVKHRRNIRRLLAGTENRVGSKRAGAEQSAAEPRREGR